MDGIDGHFDGRASDARFYQPSGVIVDPRAQIVISDSWNHCIRLLGTDGFVRTLAGAFGQFGSDDTPTQMQHATASARRMSEIRAEDTEKTGEKNRGTASSASAISFEAKFSQPAGICIDTKGRIVVADRENNRKNVP